MICFPFDSGAAAPANVRSRREKESVWEGANTRFSAPITSHTDLLTIEKKRDSLLMIPGW
jgi:hypothetical protein